MSPAPTTAEEVQHLYQSFKKLGGSLEYFEISRGKTGHNTYGNEASLIFNPSSQLSQLNPFNSTDKNVKESNAELLSLQRKLSNTIHSICAIPRHSFIENDEHYTRGEIEIPYKYRLNRDGLKYDNRYSISSSIINNQFAYISPIPVSDDDNKHSMSDSVISDFKSHMRHNFQKFHKFDSILISHAIPHINQLIRGQKLDADIKQSESISYGNLMDLDSDMETEGSGEGIDLRLQRLAQGFKGFYE